MSQQSPIIFVHKYVVNNSGNFRFPSPERSRHCICKACEIQEPLLSKLSTLFFVGFLCPFIYLYIWWCRARALILYHQQMKETKDFEMEINSMNDNGSVANSPDITISQSENIKFQRSDAASAVSSSDPFSNKYAIDDEPNTLGNEDYDFEAHCYTNLVFRAWCYRSLIAFTCQLCIAIVIICAVVLTRHKRIATNNNGTIDIAIPSPDDLVDTSEGRGIFTRFV